jgi:hypothetical protein
LSAGVGSGVFAGGTVGVQALKISRPAVEAISRLRRASREPRVMTERTGAIDMDIKTLQHATLRACTAL